MKPLDRALASLRALALGDAFGERFFAEPEALAERELPTGLWKYTDDTHMAISVVRVLRDHGRIDQDALAHAFARAHADEPWRGYAGGAARLLTRIRFGCDWREESAALFDGGSWGNGGAMRAAPVGAYFADDLQRAADEGGRSAAVTHAHPEGIAGGRAIAASAALHLEGARGTELISAVRSFIDAPRVGEGLELATRLPADDVARAARELGTGDAVSAMDTVPFCVWMAAHHGADFQDAMWKTVSGLGDRDTTCAIVAGILGGDGRPLPEDWTLQAEELPSDVELG